MLSLRAYASIQTQTHTYTHTHAHTHKQLLNMFNVQGEAELACVCYDAQIIIIEEGVGG